MTITQFLKVALIFMTLIAISACAERENKSESGTMVAIENGKFISHLIVHPDVEPYFHVETPERVPLIIRVDEEVKLSDELRKDGEAVVITNKAPVSAPYLEVNQLEHRGKTIQFKVRYDIEGVVIVGHYLKDEGIFKDIKVIEK